MSTSFPRHNSIQISVVIPTYNRATLAARAVESVLAQTIAPNEVIVVDDGSSDGTRSVIESTFGSQVQYLYQDNAGSAVARNKGFHAAKYEWVALLDSDDIWVPEHLERMMNAIAGTGGKANYYFADTIRPPEKGGGSLWHARGLTITPPYELRSDASDWALMRPQPMMLQSSLFSRSAYMACGGFLPRLRYRDDTHLFLKLGLSGPVCAVAGAGTHMTADDVPENRLTLTYDAKKRKEGSWMQVWMFTDLLKSLELPAETQHELCRRLAAAYRSLAGCAWHEHRLHSVGWYLFQSQRVKLLNRP